MSAERLQEWDQWLDLMSPRAKTVQQSIARKKQVEKPRWYLVIVPDDDEPDCLPFDTFEELLAEIKGIEAPDEIAVFPFYGMRCHLNRVEGNAQLHYLRHPAGELHPLFDSAPGVVQVDSGHFFTETFSVEETPTGPRRYQSQAAENEVVESEDSSTYSEVEDEPDPEPEDEDDALDPSDDAFPL